MSEHELESALADALNGWPMGSRGRAEVLRLWEKTLAYCDHRRLAAVPHLLSAQTALEFGDVPSAQLALKIALGILAAVPVERPDKTDVGETPG